MSTRIPASGLTPAFHCESLESRLLMAVQGEQTIPITVINRQQLELTGIQSAAEVLKLVPGACDAQVVVRGDNLTQTQKGNDYIINGSNFSIDSIDLTNTSDRSSLTFFPAKGFTIPVRDISSTGVVGKILGKGVNLTGSATLPGARTLAFESLSGANINVVPLQSFQCGPITDSRLSFSDVGLFQSGPINSSSAGGSSLQGLSIDKFLIKGDANTDFTFNSDVGMNLRSAVITGSVTGGTWSVRQAGSLTADAFGTDWQGLIDRLDSVRSPGAFNGFLQSRTIGKAQFGSANGAMIFLTQPFSANGFNLGSLKVAGPFSDSFIQSDGNLGSLNFGAFNSSSVWAGVSGTSPLLLPTIPQVQSNTTIRSFKSNSFSNSYLSAGRLGPTTLGPISQQFTPGNPYGITTYKLDRIRLDLGGRPFSATNVDRTQDVLNAEQRAHVGPTQLGDFNIRLSM